MIAILDEETLRDMRYTFRCYEANIKQAKSGKRMPAPAALLDQNAKLIEKLDEIKGMGTDCWLYRVAHKDGVQVHIKPNADAPSVAFRDKNEFLKGVELGTYDGKRWLRVVEDDKWLEEQAYANPYKKGVFETEEEEESSEEESSEEES